MLAVGDDVCIYVQLPYFFRSYFDTVRERTSAGCFPSLVIIDEQQEPKGMYFVIRFSYINQNNRILDLVIIKIYSPELFLFALK